MLHIDSLHTFDLGITQSFCKFVVWSLFNANAWSRNGEADERDQMSLICLRGELFAWYKTHRRTSTLTEVQDLCPNMLGTHAKPDFKLKAMETRCFLPFAVDVLKRRGASLGHPLCLIDAG